GGRLMDLAPDILMECTGVPAIIRDCLAATAPAGIVCLTGVTELGKVLDLDVGRLNRTMVLDNDVVFGTVNANRRHYEMAAEALAGADRSWLERLITRRLPLERWCEALEHRQGDIKVIIDVAQCVDARHGSTPHRSTHRGLRADRRLRGRRARLSRRLDRLAVLAAVRFRRLFRCLARERGSRALAHRAAPRRGARHPAIPAE